MLQFITHHNSRFGYVDGARMALEGGCRWVQLRMKEASEAELIETGKAIRQLCDRYGARFIIDDHVELVAHIGADGVHLGRQDMPVDEARRVLGSDYIIGGTANTLADVVRLNRLGANYIGCGPFRFTTTKQRLSPILGLEGYAEVVQGMRREGIAMPIVAIGGILLDDVSEIMATGVNGVAISGAILNAHDPVAETAKFITELSK